MNFWATHGLGFLLHEHIIRNTVEDHPISWLLDDRP